MEFMSLFPIAIGQTKIEPSQSEIDFISKNSKLMRPNVGNLTGVNHYILDLHELMGLKIQLTDAVNHYFRTVVAPSTDAHLYITQSWLNVTKKGQFHHKHTHSGSILSGVWYHETDDQDRITFSKSGHETIEFRTNSFNQFNSKTWWIQAKKHDLIIFPSSTEHFVPNVETEHDRISLAFNTWFHGSAGSYDDLTGLYLPNPIHDKNQKPI